MDLARWKALAPHRPLGEGDPLRVARPWDGGEALAARIRGGFSPIAIAGPVGSGKSTELSAAADALKEDHLPFLLDFDRDGLGGGGSDELFRRLARILVRRAPERGLSIPDSLRKSSESKLNTFLMVVRTLSATRRVVLLLDGLEKSHDLEAALSMVRWLRSVGPELAWAVVVPPALVTGPEAHEVVSELRVFAVRALPVLEARQMASSFIAARRFLSDVATRRLGGPEPLTEGLFNLAAVLSGGLPRTFLQLLQDAAGHAALGSRAEPGVEDLARAAADHRDSLTRLLRDGDLSALKAADGTTGLEVPIERRLRFLTHGVLLEYPVGDRVLVHPHPLLWPTLGLKGP